MNGVSPCTRILHCRHQLAFCGYVAALAAA